MKSPQDVLTDFASLLTLGDFPNAAFYILKSERSRYEPHKLSKKFLKMMEIDNLNEVHIKYELVNTMLDWPDRKPIDVLWGYVAIWSEDVSEAFSAVVCKEGDELKLYKFEWGRP